MNYGRAVRGYALPLTALYLYLICIEVACMEKREYTTDVKICGDCLHYRPSWETVHLTGWHCDNFLADAHGSALFNDDRTCPDFESKD